jgi:hypothetical protein
MGADCGRLDVARRGIVEVMLWGRFSQPYKVRVMKSLPLRMLVGRGLCYGMYLDFKARVRKLCGRDQTWNSSLQRQH